MNSQNAALRVGVLISGTGRSLQNFLTERDAGRLPVDFAVVLSSTPEAKGLDFAREASIPHAVVRRRDSADIVQYGEALAALLREHRVDLVVMAGFLHLWKVPADFAGKVMNIHPSLLPAFGGRGFYGSRVHQAVVDSGVKVSGCTVHFADDQYDTGPIVSQSVVPVNCDDDVDQVAAKVFEAECRAYPEALRLFAEGRLQCEGRRVRIRPPA